ncbi:RNA-binding protein spenito-like [Littorina saxatilis]|uniref:RNA-binding protein spenito n=1 Tax=Littorina saxatilis TaxID=31220 RepID=A0AAN9GBE3_9CAEN
MKRQQDREGSPRGSKRSRSSYGPPDHDMGRDRMSPDFDRRGGRKFMGGGPREGKPFRDYDDMDHPPRKNFRDDRMQDQGFMPPMRGGGGENDYRSLCITNIPSKVSDAALKDAMLHEFWKFGEMNVKVTFSGDQRVAYLNFRYPEDARAAKQKGRADMFDRPLRVEPVYNKRRSGSPGDFSNRDHFSFHNRRNSPPPSPYPPPPPNIGRGPPEGRQGPPSLGRGPPPFVPDRGDGPMMFNSPPPSGPLHDSEGRRNDKFPYHLDHIDPEFDEKATRTLFVGNLDVNTTDIDLKHIFDKYGYLEDIDIKRPQKGQGNAYAFIKFVNLDCAHRAKVEMSGKYVGKFQCKIGYGKVTPTTCIWVGGIGPWVSRETLEQEFDRFGAIQRIEWPSGKAFAYVLYDSIDAAKAACQEMRGCPLGGPDRRLRVDFADISHINNPVMNAGPPPRTYPPPEREFDRGGGPWRSPSGNGQMERGRGRKEEWFGDDPPGYRHSQRGGDHMPEMEGRRSRDGWGEFPDEGDRRRRPRSPGDFGGPPPFHRGSRTPDRREYQHDRGVRDDGMRGSSSRVDMGERDGGRRDEKIRSDPGDLDSIDHIRSVTDLAKNLMVAWNGALILKNSAFAARMHVVSGDVTIVDTLMRDPTTTEPPVLRITQRLRLDQPKLEDVGRRISNAGQHGHCILLAMPSTVYNYDETGVAQQRPLKNLVSYLKQKDAAGVISLPPNPTSDKNVGVLHAFPPCQFGYNFLVQRSPKLPPEFTAMKDDYLVVVVVVGAN